MKRLSNRQEQVMALIWEHGPMTVSRLIPLIDGNLHFNTISTVVRELDRIGFLCHDNGFRPFLYYPKVMKDDYIKELVDSISNRFFNGDKSKKSYTRTTSKHTRELTLKKFENFVEDNIEKQSSNAK